MDLLMNKGLPPWGFVHGNESLAGSGPALGQPRGRLRHYRGRWPHCSEETGDLALDCTTEITAAPRMQPSFINFIARGKGKGRGEPNI